MQCNYLNPSQSIHLIHAFIPPLPQPMISNMPETISFMLDRSNEDVKERYENSEKLVQRLNAKQEKLDKVKI